MLLGQSAWAGDGTAVTPEEGLTPMVLIIGGTIIAAVVIHRRRLWVLPVPRRVPAYFRPETQVVLAAGLFLLMMALSIVARGLFPAPPEGAASVSDLAAPAVLTYTITACAAAVIIATASRRTGHTPSCGPVRAVAAAFVGLALIWPLMMSAGWLMRLGSVLAGAEVPDLIAHTTLQIIAESDVDVAFLLLGACVVLGAPFIEEVLYRVLLQDAFIRAFGRPWPGIMLASGIFTLMHVPAVHWTALLPLFLFSVAVGVVYERTGRLRSIVLMHATFNLFNLILARVIATGFPGIPGIPS